MTRLFVATLIFLTVSYLKHLMTDQYQSKYHEKALLKLTKKLFKCLPVFFISIIFAPQSL